MTMGITDWKTLFGESDLDLKLLVGLTKFEITNLLALVGVAVSYGGWWCSSCSFSADIQIVAV